MKILKWAAVAVVVLVLLAGVAVAGLLWGANTQTGRHIIARQASGLLGRDVALDGPLHITLGNPLLITVEGLRIANPDWAADDHLAEVRRLTVNLRPWPVLHGDWNFPLVRVEGAALSLERNGQGATTWAFGTPGAAVAEDVATPETRRDAPVIGRLEIDGSRVRYRDALTDLDLDTTVSTATGDNHSDRMAMEGKGTFAGEAFTLTAQGGSLLSLRDGNAPYPVKVSTVVGKARSTVEGTLDEPVLFQGVNLAVHLQGDDLSRLVGLFGVVFPKTRAYDLSAQLARDAAVWTLTGIKGRVGESDLSGDVRIDTGGSRPRINGDLTSRRLAAVDLAGFVGASPRGRGDYDTKNPARVLPATPVSLEKLRTADMDIRFTGKRVEAPGTPLDDLSMHLVLEDGRAVFDPLALGMAGGRIEGTVELNGRENVPALAADLAIRRVDLAAFFRGTDFARQMGGTINGSVRLKGHGPTVADMLGVADGKAGMAVDGGRISLLAVKGLKTNILETLGIALSGDRSVPFNCIVADLEIQRGVVRSKALVLDTPEAVVTGGGVLNLKTEAMDFRIRGEAKEAQIFATHVPVSVQGTLLNPELSFDPTESIARGAGAVALGVLLTPLAAVVPLLDAGSDEQPRCKALVRNAKDPAKAGKTGSGDNQGKRQESGSGR
ncbi:uncharacterized protein involved in outer membrane biogenesis [Azospirillum fermentarium]|uniref:AsmA family protein n=1 Tax=Azospirillum fermentarium TaxID=1233114 RepID=UPI002227D8DF|nr:AsmA family protein [Azospirillum fermentarium]MCW2247635.1 uncharacterized protein involved in outer membrane biogenesis [Azospirillum fermentarium]